MKFKFFDRLYKWLMPGMKIKRWIFLSWIGLSIFSIGLILLINIKTFIPVELAMAGILEKIIGRPVGTRTVDLLMVIIGMLILLVGIRQWFDSIYRAVVPNQGKSLVDVIYEKRHLAHGFKITALGGGTGLSSLLRGLKAHTSNITAVVTVADDGGSSGRLRKEMGVLPPGDIRNCLVALADQESLMGELFQYRFTDGESLEGHSFGNLFLVAMTEVAGDFDQAIKKSSKILAIRGRVIPSTLSPVTLCAEMKSGEVVKGESSITHDRRQIDRVYLEPGDCRPPDEVIEAIADCDLVLLGPGSLFTSVLPNLKVRGMVEAINRSRAEVIYICNVMTQPGETDGFGASDHLKALLKSVPDLKVDYCLVNDEQPPSQLLEKYEKEGQIPVKANREEFEKMGVELIHTPLISTTDLVRHDSDLLARSVVDILEKSSRENRE